MNDRIVVSWPAKRLYDVVMTGNARPTVAATARMLKLETAVVIDALIELHDAGVVPADALQAALAERP